MQKFETNDLPDLSFEQQAQLEKIEQLNGTTTYEKAQLILVFLDEIKAYKINVDGLKETHIITKLDLKQAGLTAIIHPREKQTDPDHFEKYNTFSVSKDDSLAQRMATDPKDMSDNEVLQATGWPESSIRILREREEDITAGQSLSQERMQQEGIIFRMPLSNDNMEQEVKLLKKRSDLIKKYSPATFKEIYSEQNPE
jgi:hypothetical protein